MRKTTVFYLIFCFGMNSLAFGALNAYMRLVGEKQGEIKGSVIIPGREDSIMVIAFNHDVFSLRDAASGLPTSKRQHEPLCVTKEIDKSTPLLMNAWSNGEMMRNFELNFWRPSNSGQEVQFYTIRLRGAQIISIHQEMLNNKSSENNMQLKEMESITFVYRTIEWIYEDGGINFEDEWRYPGTNLLVSDLSGDGVVNLLDLSIFASEWLESAK